jgi:hypothetical protein
VVGERHALAALPPGKTRYPLYRRLGGPQDWSERVRKILAPPGFDPWTAGCGPTGTPKTQNYQQPTVLALLTPLELLAVWSLSAITCCVESVRHYLLCAVCPPLLAVWSLSAITCCVECVRHYLLCGVCPPLLAVWSLSAITCCVEPVRHPALERLNSHSESKLFRRCCLYRSYRILIFSVTTACHFPPLLRRACGRSQG